jgi:hypothetical protein
MGAALKVAPAPCARPLLPGHNPGIPERSNSLGPPAKPEVYQNEIKARMHCLERGRNFPRYPGGHRLRVRNGGNEPDFFSLKIIPRRVSRQAFYDGQGKGIAARRDSRLSIPLLINSLSLNNLRDLNPLLEKGSCEKIEWRHAKASFVARGRGKFTAPKPGGRCMAGKNLTDFRQATPATCANSYKYERTIVSVSVV